MLQHADHRIQPCRLVANLTSFGMKALSASKELDVFPTG